MAPWSDDDTKQFNAWFCSLSEQRQNEIDAKAVGLFCNLWMMNLIDPAAPKVATQLTGEWLAKFRNLVLMTEPTFSPQWRKQP